METVHSIFDFTPTHETFVTIGTFDGVHIGHQKIVHDLVKQAHDNNKKSALLTFFPHPRMVLQKDASIELINTIDERIDLLEKTGLDYLIIHPFSREFSRLSARDFVRNLLVNQLKVSKLIIGYDHHFGKNREGNIEQLTEYSHIYNFKVQEIPAQDIDSVAVSSTKIRRALKEGALKTANRYLGYNYTLKGKVVDGKKVGNTIGFPTANIEIEEDYKLIPKVGVYVIQSTIQNRLFYGMMNIGNRPTLNGNNQTIEVNFFDFSENLYGETLKIELLFFLRNEVKFDSIEALTDQLKQDKLASLTFINNNM